MADEIEKELDGVTTDDPAATDTETHEPTDAELQERLQAVRDVKPTEEKPAEAKPEVKPEAKPEENPETKPETPVVDVEAEIEKRLQAKLAEKEAERAKAEQERIQKAVDSVIAKERKRDESAMRKLRDLQAATGMDVDKLLESNRARQVERLQTEQGLSEEAARTLVMAQEEAALLKAREADRQRQFQEAEYANKYRTAKLDFLAAKDVPEIYRKAMEKYGSEIDTLANFGRPTEDGRLMDFDVALKYVAGQHLPDIMVEMAREAEAEKAKLRADAEAREKAAEQRAIRNIQERGKAAPETGTQGVPPKESLPGEVQRLAIAMGVSPEDVAKTRAARLKAQKR